MLAATRCFCIAGDRTIDGGSEGATRCFCFAGDLAKEGESVGIVRKGEGWLLLLLDRSGVSNVNDTIGTRTGEVGDGGARLAATMAA